MNFSRLRSRIARILATARAVRACDTAFPRPPRDATLLLCRLLQLFGADRTDVLKLTHEIATENMEMLLAAIHSLSEALDRVRTANQPQEEDEA